MKKISFLVFVCCVACCGCSSITGSRTNNDGTVLSVKSTRVFWASEGISFSVSDTNGFKTTLEVTKSSTDVAAIKAALEGAATLASKAAK